MISCSDDRDRGSMMKPSRTVLPLLTAALLAPVVPAFAQVPALAQAPRIKSVFPPGVRRGSGAAITLTGVNLKPGSQVLVSGEGVTAAVTAVGAPPKEDTAPTEGAARKEGAAPTESAAP